MKTIPLSKIAEVTAGQSAPQDKNVFGHIGYPFIRAGSLDPLLNGTTEDNLEILTNEGAKAHRMRLFPPDTIVFAKSGMSAKLGRVYRLKSHCYVVSHLATILPGEDLHPGYLQRWLEQNPPSRLIPNDAYPSIRLSEISKLQIPAIEFNKQKRIAEILDKADSIRRKRVEAIRLYDDFLKSAFLDMFGDPVANPKGWNRKPFGDLLLRIDSGTSPRCFDRPITGNEWGVLKLGAVTYCEYNPADHKALPEGVVPDPSNEVQVGDLLFTRKNTYDLVGASALVYETPHHLLLPDLIFRFQIRNSEEICKEYLWGLLTCSTKRKQVQSLAGGAAGSMPNISKGRLEKMDIELPDYSLQLKYRDLLYKRRSAFNTGCNALRMASELFSSLAQRAFHGAL